MQSLPTSLAGKIWHPAAASSSKSSRQLWRLGKGNWNLSLCAINSRISPHACQSATCWILLTGQRRLSSSEGFLVSFISQRIPSLYSSFPWIEARWYSRQSPVQLCQHSELPLDLQQSTWPDQLLPVLVEEDMRKQSVTSFIWAWSFLTMYVDAVDPCASLDSSSNSLSLCRLFMKEK